MRTEQIHFFLALAETLNFTEAANRLYITQPSLSRSIAQMERELGVQLFKRSRRQVSLTAAGQRFYQDCGKILETIDETVKRAKSAERGEYGQIRFACHTSQVEPLVLDIISDFCMRHPWITMDIVAQSTSEMVYALTENRVDCLIGAGLATYDGVERLFLKQYRDCVVLASHHPLAAHGELSVLDLKKEDHVVLSREVSSRGYDRLIGRAKRAGYDPQIRLYAQSVPHLLTLLTSGRLVSIISENYRHLASDRIAFIPLAEKEMTDLFFYWRPGNDNPCLRLLADHVRDHYSRPYPEPRI